jgi:hypothetical protein
VRPPAKSGRNFLRITTGYLNFELLTNGFCHNSHCRFKISGSLDLFEGCSEYVLIKCKLGLSISVNAGQRGRLNFECVSFTPDCLCALLSDSIFRSQSWPSPDYRLDFWSVRQYLAANVANVLSHWVVLPFRSCQGLVFHVTWPRGAIRSPIGIPPVRSLELQSLIGLGRG